MQQQLAMAAHLETLPDKPVAPWESLPTATYLALPLHLPFPHRRRVERQTRKTLHRKLATEQEIHSSRQTLQLEEVSEAVL